MPRRSLSFLGAIYRPPGDPHQETETCALACTRGKACWCLPLPPDAAGGCPLPCHGNGELASDNSFLLTLCGDEVFSLAGSFAALPRGGCRRGSPFLWDSPCALPRGGYRRGSPFTRDSPLTRRQMVRRRASSPPAWPPRWT
ncbi:UNVERIFIED_CONTAM: hypothetical protein FKN15_007232 [Acipenser sinensis]